MHSKFLISFIIFLCVCNRISKSSSLINIEDISEAEEDSSNETQVLETSTSISLSSSDASNTSESTEVFNVPDITSTTDPPTTEKAEVTSKSVFHESTTETMARPRRQDPLRRYVPKQRVAPPSPKKYPPSSTLFEMCPPLEMTCPVCSVSQNQLYHYICNYPVVLKVLILSPPETDSSGRMCGKLGKLSVHGTTGSNQFRSLLRFSVKDTCGCQLKVSQHYFLLTQISEFTKQGRVYSKVSLSDKSLLVPVDQYTEPDILNLLASCSSEQRIGGIPNVQDQQQPSYTDSPYNPFYVTSDFQPAPHDPSLPEVISSDSTQRVSSRSARDPYGRMSQPNYLPPSQQNRFFQPAQYPFAQVSMGTYPNFPPMTFPPPMIPSPPMTPFPPLVMPPIPQIRPLFSSQQQNVQNGPLPGIYVPPLVYNQAQPGVHRSISYSSTNQGHQVNVHANVQFHSTPLPNPSETLAATQVPYVPNNTPPNNVPNAPMGPPYPPQYLQNSAQQYVNSSSSFSSSLSSATSGQMGQSYNSPLTNCLQLPQTCPCCVSYNETMFREAYCNSKYAFISTITFPDHPSRQSAPGNDYGTGPCLNVRAQLLHDVSKTVEKYNLYQSVSLLLPINCRCFADLNHPAIVFFLGFDDNQPTPPQTQLYEHHDLFLLSAPSDTTLPHCPSYKAPAAHDEVKSDDFLHSHIRYSSDNYPNSQPPLYPATVPPPAPENVEYPLMPPKTIQDYAVSVPETAPNSNIQIPHHESAVYQEYTSSPTAQQSYEAVTYPSPTQSQLYQGENYPLSNQPQLLEETNYPSPAYPPSPQQQLYTAENYPSRPQQQLNTAENYPSGPQQQTYEAVTYPSPFQSHNQAENYPLPVEARPLEEANYPSPVYPPSPQQQLYPAENHPSPFQPQQPYGTATFPAAKTYIQEYEAGVCPSNVVQSCPLPYVKYEASHVRNYCSAPFAIIVELQGPGLQRPYYTFPRISIKTTSSTAEKTVVVSVSSLPPLSCSQRSVKVFKNIGTQQDKFREGSTIPIVLVSNCNFYFARRNKINRLLLYSSTLPNYIPNEGIQITENIHIVSLEPDQPLPSCIVSRPIYISPPGYRQPSMQYPPRKHEYPPSPAPPANVPVQPQYRPRPEIPPPPSYEQPPPVITPSPSYMNTPPPVVHRPQDYARYPYYPENKPLVYKPPPIYKNTVNTPPPVVYRPSEYLPPSPPEYKPQIYTPPPEYKPLVYTHPPEYKPPSYTSPPAPLEYRPPYVHPQRPTQPPAFVLRDPYARTTEQKPLLTTCPKPEQPLTCPTFKEALPLNFHQLYCMSKFAMVVAIGVDKDAKYITEIGGPIVLPFLKSKRSTLGYKYNDSTYSYNVTVTRGKTAERKINNAAYASLRTPAVCQNEKVLGLYDVSPERIAHEYLVELDLYVPLSCDFSAFDISPAYGILMSLNPPNPSGPILLSQEFAFFPLAEGKLTLPTCIYPPHITPTYDDVPSHRTQYVPPSLNGQRMDVSCTNDSCGTCSFVNRGNDFNVPCDMRFAALVEIIETSADLNIAPSLDIYHHQSKEKIIGTILHVKSNVPEKRYANPPAYESNPTTHYSDNVKCSYAKVRVVQDLSPYSTYPTRDKELTLIIPVICNCHLFDVDSGFAVLLTKFPVLSNFVVPMTGDFSTVACLPSGSVTISTCPTTTHANWLYNTQNAENPTNQQFSYSFSHAQTSEPSSNLHNQYNSYQLTSPQYVPTLTSYSTTPLPYVSAYTPNPDPYASYSLTSETHAPAPISEQYASTDSPYVPAKNPYSPKAEPYAPYTHASNPYSPKAEPYAPHVPASNPYSPKAEPYATYAPPSNPYSPKAESYATYAPASNPYSPKAEPYATYAPASNPYSPKAEAYAPAPIESYVTTPESYMPQPVPYKPVSPLHIPAQGQYSYPSQESYYSSPTSYRIVPDQSNTIQTQYGTGVPYNQERTSYTTASEFYPPPHVLDVSKSTSERYPDSYTYASKTHEASANVYAYTTTPNYYVPDVKNSVGSLRVSSVPDNPPFCTDHERAIQQDCPVCEEIRCIKPEVYCNSKLAVLARPNGVYNDDAEQSSGNIISLYEISSHKPAQRAVSNIIYKLPKRCSCPMLEDTSKSSFVVVLIEDEISLLTPVIVHLDEGDYIYSTSTGRITLPSCSSDQPRTGNMHEEIILPSIQDSELPDAPQPITCPELDHSCPKCESVDDNEILKNLVCASDNAILISLDAASLNGSKHLWEKEQITVTQHIAQNYSIGIEIKPHKYENRCIQPEEPGDCNLVTTRFHYDTIDEVCYAFDYSGCNGNANNFETEEECEETCMKNDKCDKGSLNIHKIIRGSSEDHYETLEYVLPEQCNCAQLKTGEIGYLLFNTSSIEVKIPTQFNQNYHLIRLSYAQQNTEIVCDGDLSQTNDVGTDTNNITDTNNVTDTYNVTDTENSVSELNGEGTQSTTSTTTKKPKRWFG